MKNKNATSIDQQFVQTEYEPLWMTWLGCLITGLIIFMALVVL